MLGYEVFICKFAAIDADAASPISFEEIPTLSISRLVLLEIPTLSQDVAESAECEP